MPKALSGAVWAKFEILTPFFAPNDTRELGIAFKSIQFLETAPTLKKECEGEFEETKVLVSV